MLPLRVGQDPTGDVYGSRLLHLREFFCSREDSPGLPGLFVVLYACLYVGVRPEFGLLHFGKPNSVTICTLSVKVRSVCIFCERTTFHFIRVHFSLYSLHNHETYTGTQFVDPVDVSSGVTRVVDSRREPPLQAPPSERAAQARDGPWRASRHTRITVHRRKIPYPITGHETAKIGVRPKRNMHVHDPASSRRPKKTTPPRLACGHTGAGRTHAWNSTLWIIGGASLLAL